MDNYTIHMDRVPSAISLGVLRVECVGPMFLSHVYNTPLVLEDANQNSSKANDKGSSSNIDYDEPIYKNLHGKNLKEQDHYAILALGHLRIKATEDDIKSAYRKQVLRHHPDKRKVNEAHRGQSHGGYFSRITKAWEILGNPQKRRSYDSIDPCFDNSIPSANEYNRRHFYTVFGKAFELNSRWSEKKPVPQLGDDSTAKDDVLHFYSFWYNFVSWREFSYLDSEEASTDYCREMRKCVQKENKQQRAKRKKEETTRIRKLVDTAYGLDPRILRYKKEEEAAKEAMKQAKKNLIKMKREEEERKHKAAEDAIRLEKKRQVEEEKARQSALKAERAANKQALKKARSALRKLVKENNYFCDGPEELIKHMTNTEKLCESLDVEELNELISTMASGGREVFLIAVEQVEKSIRDKEQKVMHQTSVTSSTFERTKDLNIIPWTPEEIQVLHKAMVAFPTGTNKRWECVSDYINEHYRMQDSVKRSPKEVLLKARELQNNVYCRKTSSNSDTIINLNNSNSHSGGDAHTSTLDMEAKQSNIKASWTPEEQKLLENALIMFPVSSPDRWDKIAAHVPNKTKKECINRYKQIAEMLKLKRTGQNSQLLR